MTNIAPATLSWPWSRWVMIDMVLAGDNAVVIGLAAAGLPAKQRKRAIIIGILTATALRIAFASIAACRRHSSPLGLLEDVARAPRDARLPQWKEFHVSAKSGEFTSV